jgi:eukaryotic-like serine/threonine-protein kinase
LALSDIRDPVAQADDAWIPQAGEVVAGKYRIGERIGTGGMGIVVSAEHVLLSDRIALKLLNPALATTGANAARFLREAKATSRIKSEHVVRVMDAGTTDAGVHYIAMELLEGEDLLQAIKDGPLDISLAVDCILQAAEGLAEAHALGVVHRDIKPSNLWLTRRRDGSPLVKVLDFGISKLLPDGEGTPRLTRSGAIFGSPKYMSPEQLRSAKDADAKSDVWALGVALHEILTGSLPFAGTTVTSVLVGIAAGSPIRLRTVREGAPEGIERAILACLKKDRAKRASLADLAVALRPFASKDGALSADRVIGASGHPITPRKSLPPDYDTLAFDATQPNLSTTQPVLPSPRGHHSMTVRIGALALIAASSVVAYRFFRAEAPPPASPTASTIDANELPILIDAASAPTTPPRGTGATPETSLPRTPHPSPSASAAAQRVPAPSLSNGGAPISTVQK